MMHGVKGRDDEEEMVTKTKREEITKTRREEKTRGRRIRVDMNNDLVLEAAHEQAADPPGGRAFFHIVLGIYFFLTLSRFRLPLGFQSWFHFA